MRTIKTAGYSTGPAIDKKEYPSIQGMEGPMRMPSGRILYYDPKQGEYYDRKVDMFVPADEAMARPPERDESFYPHERTASKEDPCWDGYEQVGMKKKDGKEVPNCVPEDKESASRNKDSEIYKEGDEDAKHSSSASRLFKL